MAELKKVQRIEKIDNMPIREGNVAVKAVIEILGEVRNYTAEPIFVIEENRVGSIPRIYR